MQWNWPLPSALPITASNGKKWNFLLMVGDDWPLDMFSEMPTFNSTYASGFIVFPNAVSEIPLCFPSRASTYTGQSARYTTVTSNNNGDTYSVEALYRTVHTSLQGAGYHVGFVGKVYNGLGEGGAGGFGTLPWHHPGVNYMAGQWDAPDYFDWLELKSDGTTTAHGTTDTNAAGTDYAVDVERLRALTFLSGVPTGKPWFLTWASKGCHQGNHGGGEPEPPSRYASTSVTLTEDPKTFGVDPTSLGIPDWAANDAEAPWNSTAIDAIRTSHRLALRVTRAIDEGLCAVLAQIEARGETANTIVMVMCDNAIGMGELRMNGKGNPHKSGTDILLRVKVPGISGNTCYAPVCNYDIAPTICALAGAVPAVTPYGMSFHSLLEDVNKPWREAAFMINPDRSPTFYGLKFGGNPGAVYYRIAAGGGNTPSTGGWTDLSQSVNVDIPGAAEILQTLEDSVS